MQTRTISSPFFSSHRSSLEIFIDVCSTIQEQGLARPSRVASLANINFQRAQRILSTLLEEGVVIQSVNPRGTRKLYSLSDEGVVFLELLESINVVIAGGSAGGESR